ncbi:hypothetical protein [Brevundimonas fluminis]|jgi:hypothetical protein|uniref:hypothetical protein n=1 Tax=Brevundimonas fluminis TaxID=2487274 RepID=UPI000F6575A0|nr:hypothetical protein [Brevundimonas fluminis]
MELSISHRRLAVAAGVGVIALGLAAGAAVLTPSGSAEAKGEALKIALFTPPAPKIDPGETMEVGELTDGYVHRPAPRPEPIEWVEFDEGWWDVDDQEPPQQVAHAPTVEPIPVRPAPPERSGGDAMGFGFDSREQAERRVMRSAPPERRPMPQGAEAPPRVMVSGERQAVFY